MFILIGYIFFLKMTQKWTLNMHPSCNSIKVTFCCDLWSIFFFYQPIIRNWLSWIVLKCANLYIWEFGNNLLPTPLQAHILWPITISHKKIYQFFCASIWESTQSTKSRQFHLLYHEPDVNCTWPTFIISWVHVVFFKLEVPDKPQNILTSKKNHN